MTMQKIATIAKRYVDGRAYWFAPAKVNLSAIPKALNAMTEIAPVAAQIER